MKTFLTYYNRLSLLALAVFILLVLLQSLWLRNAIQMQQQEMKLKLKQLIPDLALDINSLGHDYFHGDSTPIHELEIQAIEEKIKLHLDSNGIENETYFGIFKETNSNFFIGNNYQNKTALIETDVRACMSCIVSFNFVEEEFKKRLPDETDKEYSDRLSEKSSFQYFSPVKGLPSGNKEVIWLSLYQPNSYSDAVRAMIWLFVVSMLLLIVLFYLFYHLLRLLSNYKKLTELKEDFFNNMTHEFKTPLSSIRLASRVLRQNKDVEKSKLYYDLIEKESKTLELQIDKLLELSLLDTKEIDLEKENIDLHELIKEIPNRLKPLLDSKQGEIIFNLKLENTNLKGDSNHLSNSIANLVENSLKYADKEVTIWIDTLKKGDSKIIIVRDNGPGIQPEFQPHIFERFYRAKKNNQYKTQGFGIGLSYVKSIIEAHNGTIVLNPNYTEGCEFIIKLKR